MAFSSMPLRVASSVATHSLAILGKVCAGRRWHASDECTADQSAICRAGGGECGPFGNQRKPLGDGLRRLALGQGDAARVGGLGIGIAPMDGE